METVVGTLALKMEVVSYVRFQVLTAASMKMAVLLSDDIGCTHL
jgi:hypothetical protein